MRSDKNIITSSLAERKNTVFLQILSHILFKRLFITDHSLVNEFNLNVSQKVIWKQI